MKPVARGMVVCCPKCGTIASVIGIGIGQYVCKNCKTKFTCWVVNGFSVTFEDDGDKNYVVPHKRDVGLNLREMKYTSEEACRFSQEGRGFEYKAQTKISNAKRRSSQEGRGFECWGRKNYL